MGIGNKNKMVKLKNMGGIWKKKTMETFGKNMEELMEHIRDKNGKYLEKLEHNYGEKMMLGDFQGMLIGNFFCRFPANIITASSSINLL